MIVFRYPLFRIPISEFRILSVVLVAVLQRAVFRPVDDAVFVDGDIIIIEGNYLLLNEDGWRDLSDMADYTISITADS
jgi:pantothenate kinase